MPKKEEVKRDVEEKEEGSENNENKKEKKWLLKAYMDLHICE